MNKSPLSFTPLQLSAYNLHFGYQGHAVLAGVSLSLKSGELVSLLGANGAGKSTLLRLLMGFMQAQKGEVQLAGKLLSEYPRRQLAQYLAYVPQAHITPFPYRVHEIVMLGRLPSTGLGRAPGKVDFETVDAVLERLGISHLSERVYTEISGGERRC